jgi:TP901 family phage tail tape measure protein
MAGGLKVGDLFAALHLDKSGFDQGVHGAGQKFGSFVNLIKKGALLAAAAIVGIGVASIKLAADFDSAMTESLAIMGNVTDEMRDRMEQAARDVAKTSTFSAKQAAESYFFLASAGLDAAASIEAMPVVAKFAQAGMFDMARATDLLTDAQSALGLTIRDDAVANMENMIKVSDVLVRANVLSNATVEQFSEALTNKAGPALKALGKDIEEGVAVLAAFADQGIKGEEAGTALGIVLRDLQTANITNKDAWEKHGVAIFDAEGDMRNMADIVGDLEGLLGGMSDEQKKVTLAELGFADRSMGFLLALLGQSEAIRNYEKELRSASGYTEDVAGKQLESFSARMTILMHKVQDVGIAIGQILLPILEPMVDAIAEWFDANGELITSLAVGIIGAIGKVAEFIGAVLTPAFEVIGDVIHDLFGEEMNNARSGVQEFADDSGTSVGSLAGVFTWLAGTVVPALGAALDWIAVNVIPVVLAAVDLAIAIAEDLGEKFEWIAENVLPPLAELLTGIAEVVLPIVTSALEEARKHWDLIFPLLVAMILGVVVPAFVAWALAAATAAIATIVALAPILIPIIAIGLAIAALILIWQHFGGEITNIISMLAAIVGVAFGAIGSAISGTWNGIVSTIRGAINTVIGMINSFIRFVNSIQIHIPAIGFGPVQTPRFDWWGLRLPPIPYLAEGVQGFGGGLAMVGERGPEIVELPRGSNVFPHGTGPGGGVVVQGPLINIESFRGTEAEVSDLSRRLAREVRLRTGLSLETSTVS